MGFRGYFGENSRLFFNPVAHRKAKIVYNFGLSECNRVVFHNHNIFSDAEI